MTAHHPKGRSRESRPSKWQRARQRYISLNKRLKEKRNENQKIRDRFLYFRLMRIIGPGHGRNALYLRGLRQRGYRSAAGQHDR